MLRISRTQNNGKAILTLEGRLCGPWVDEMEKDWMAHLVAAPQSPLEVRLQDVSYLDDRGRDLLLRMEREGASLVGASEFLRYLLSLSKRAQGESYLSGKEKHNGSSIRS